MKTRTIVAVCAAWLVAVPAADAFSKFEHEQLTYYAFEHVRARACPADAPRSPLCKAEISSQDLAFVARAVDYFTYPMRLAPWPEYCNGGEKSQCRKKVRQAKECQQDFTFEGCAEKALTVTQRRVRKRQGNGPYRFLAVHRNDEHFRGTACTSFNERHDRAFDLADRGSLELALVAEAVALHFLQDALAPGHLAAPRDQFSDWQAGAVHDRYNRGGLPVTIAGSVCDGAARLREVDTIPTPGSWSDVKEPKLIAWERLRDDLSALEQHCAAGVHAYTAHGDKSLLPRITDRDARLHAATVFYLSVAALEDLYGIAEEPAPLWMFYQRPYFDAAEKVRHLPALGFFNDGETPTPADDRSNGRRFRKPPRDPSSCPTGPASPEEVAFAYRTAGDPAADQPPQLSSLHLLNTLQIAYSTWGDARRRWEIAWDTGTRERMVTLLDDGTYARARFWRKYLGVGSLTLHHEQLRDNDVWGLGSLYTYSKQFSKFRDFDAYLGFEPGVGLYHLDGDSTTRFRGSVRAGLGISVVAVEALAEYGRSLDRGQSSEDEWRWSMNLRLRLSPTWLPRLPVKASRREVDR